MQTPEFEVVAEGLRFPEGPVARPDGTVVLVEIAAERLSRVYPDGRVEVIANLPGGPNGAAIGPDGCCYVCNNGGLGWQQVDGMLFPHDVPEDYEGGSIERVDLLTGKVERVYERCGNLRLRGPNDLVFDRSGNFWFTDTGKLRSRSIERGAVYYATPDGSRIDELVQPTDLANGIALSPAEDHMYFCETLNGRLWDFSLTEAGEIAPDSTVGNPDSLLYAPGGFVGFDSMAVDSAGNVCQATLFKGGISVVSPGGELLDFFALPDPLVTNICFGGDDFRTAYITLSGTGKLVKMRWPRPGLVPNFFDR